MQIEAAFNSEAGMETLQKNVIAACKKAKALAIGVNDTVLPIKVTWTRKSYYDKHKTSTEALRIFVKPRRVDTVGEQRLGLMDVLGQFVFLEVSNASRDEMAEWGVCEMLLDKKLGDTGAGVAFQEECKALGPVQDTRVYIFKVPGEMRLNRRYFLTKEEYKGSSILLEPHLYTQVVDGPTDPEECVYTTKEMGKHIYCTLGYQINIEGTAVNLQVKTPTKFDEDDEDLQEAEKAFIGQFKS